MKLLSLLFSFFLLRAIAEAAAVGLRGPGRFTRRIGRQDEDVTVIDSNAVDTDREKEEKVAILPNGCDAWTEIGAFMRFPKLLKWCLKVERENLTMFI